MRDVDWQLVSEIFADALEQPVETRASFIATRCAGQPAVLAAVERLLEAESLAEASFLKELDPASMDAVIRAVVEAPEHAGPYRLVREIGRGGMGQVFLAERADGQFEQRAAVKLLKRGMDSDAILARFLRERQILAALGHPNIARLLDGGVAEDGRPYFVMEYVEGRPITRYCDEQRLSIDARLQLFCNVCLGVEYAHRNLVVHRDLKPSNILITADGQPKLLDFGIAKVLSDDRGAAVASTLTHAGIRMLTPEYAAPEQFRNESITTSTDVFSLGAVLYELLTGCRAFTDRQGPVSPGRTLDEDAPPLAQAVAVLDAPGLETIAFARSTDPGRFKRFLAGDLGTVVATALQPVPERRYASVEALRDDIRRYQQQLPVAARPDSAAYRVSRFVRRHRVGVFSTAAVVAVVLAFGGTAVVQAERITRQAAELEVERDRARSEAAAAQSVSDFLVGVFQVSDPWPDGGGDSVRARALLDQGAERIERDLIDQPELQARMTSVMARAYDNLSILDRAEIMMQRAVELHRAAAGDTSQAVVAALQQLARIQEKQDYDAAVATLREALARQQRIDPDDPSHWSLLVDLATVLHRRGDVEGFATAVAGARELLERIPPDDIDSLDPLYQLIRLLGYARDSEGVHEAHRKLLALVRSTHGPQTLEMARAYASWAEWQIVYGPLTDSTKTAGGSSGDSLLSNSLAILETFDPPSVETASVLVRVASIAREGGFLELADSLYRVVMEVYTEQLGEDHRQLATLRVNLAITLLRRGKPAEAIPLLERAIATYRGIAESEERLAVTEWRLATALRDAGRAAESVAVFASALHGFETHFPPNYLLTANVCQDFARALIGLARPAEAEPLLRQAIATLVMRWGENDARVDEARLDLGSALTALGRFAEAGEILGGALERLETRGPDDPIARRAREAHQTLQKTRSQAGGLR